MRRVPVPFPSHSPLGSMPGKAVRTSHRAGRLRGHPDLTENSVGAAFYPGHLRAASRFWGEKCWCWLAGRKAARSRYALPRRCREDAPSPSLPALGLDLHLLSQDYGPQLRKKGRGRPKCPLSVGSELAPPSMLSSPGSPSPHKPSLRFFFPPSLLTKRSD